MQSAGIFRDAGSAKVNIRLPGGLLYTLATDGFSFTGWYFANSSQHKARLSWPSRDGLLII